MNNLANHLATGQIPKPYRRGSWRPIGHMRPSSPLLDSVRDLFEGYDQLAKDFSNAFYGNAKMMCDVAFNVTGSNGKNPDQNSCRRMYGVRAILAIRSRVFLEMLYGFSPPGLTAIAAQQAQSQTTTPAPGKERKSSKGDKDKPSEKDLKKKRGSITAETMHKIVQLPKMIQTTDKKRKESIAVPKTPTYLTVPGQQRETGSGFKAAFSRLGKRVVHIIVYHKLINLNLVSGSWAGWGSKSRTDSMKRWQSESIYAKFDVTGGENGCEIPGLGLCADIAKVN